MTDDIDNHATTLHESGGVVQPTDAQLAVAAYTGYDDYWEENSLGDETEAWLSSAKAVLALAVPQAPLQAEPVPVVASEPIYQLRNVFVGESQSTWHDASEKAYDFHPDKDRRIVYATPQAEPAVAERAVAWEYTADIGGIRFLTRTDPATWHPHDRQGFRDFKPLGYLAAPAMVASQSTPPAPLLGYEQTIDKAKACGARVTQHEIGFTHAEFAQFIASTPQPDAQVEYELDRAFKAGMAYQEKLASPVASPQPVAWTLTETLKEAQTTTCGYLWFNNPRNSNWTPLYAAPIALSPPNPPPESAAPVAVEAGREPTDAQIIEIAETMGKRVPGVSDYEVWGANYYRADSEGNYTIPSVPRLAVPFARRVLSLAAILAANPTAQPDGGSKA